MLTAASPLPVATRPIVGSAGTFVVAVLVLLLVLACVNSMKDRKLTVIPKAFWYVNGVMKMIEVQTIAKIRLVQFRAA